MRTPPEKRAKCEGCGVLLSYEIGSITWQCKDNDYCGFNECQKKDCKVGMFDYNTCKLGTKGCMLTHE